MKRYVRLYIKFLIQYIKTLVEYRVDFLIGLLGFIVIQGTGIAFIYIIFQNIPNLNGWTFNEMLFIYGFAQIPRGIDHLVTDNLWMLSNKLIVQGQFDKYLIRPMNPLFQLIAEVFQPDAFGELLIGLLLVGISLPNLNVHITFLNILIFIFFIICGSVIYTSIKLFFASLAFWIKVSRSFMWMAYTFSDFAKYPIGIYSKTVQIVISFIIPFSFTAFYPAAYFIGKINKSSSFIGTLIVSILSFAIAFTTWLKGIKAYESSGS